MHLLKNEKQYLKANNQNYLLEIGLFDQFFEICKQLRIKSLHYGKFAYCRYR